MSLRPSTPSPHRALARYQSLVDDWDGFCAALARPLPIGVWTNTLRTDPDTVAQALAPMQAQPLPWYAGAFRLPAVQSPALDWRYYAGAYHIQEEVSMLPPVLLAPRPGERVLDMCAAPGNKTAQLAVMMGNRGTLVANDRSRGRINVLRMTIERLGLVNTSITCRDAAAFPLAAGPFDRVLADVPCSCEGTSRKHPRALRNAGDQQSKALSRTQQAILDRAVRLCRPGGRIVYSTCTYAPEENEAVVDAVLRAWGPEQLRVLPTVLPGFNAAPGLTHWGDQSFHPDLQHALRIWPHQQDTGGFFAVVLQRLGGDTRGVPGAPGAPAAPARPLPPSEHPWPARLSERFGLPASTFEGVRFFDASRKYAALLAADHQPPPTPKLEMTGLFAIKRLLRFPKLTTQAAMLLGPHASKNVVTLDALGAHAYLHRETIPLTAAQVAGCTDQGYVIVRHEGFVLGLGLFFPREDGTAALQSLFPKSWAGLHRPPDLR